LLQADNTYSFDIVKLLALVHKAKCNPSKLCRCPCLQEFLDYVTLVEEQLKREQERIEVLKDQELKINKTLLEAKKLLVDGLERVESFSQRKSQLKALAVSVQNATRQLELAEESQKSEYKTLGSILLNPCPLLMPTFI
jgi:hypothetical protein